MGSDDLSAWKKRCNNKESSSWVPNNGTVHPSTHSCPAHNAPPLRIKNWLIGNPSRYAFPFFYRRGLAQRGPLFSLDRKGENICGSDCANEKSFIFLIVRVHKILGHKAELHKERLWFKVLRGMRRKCFEESFFFPLQSILTITHISSGSCIHYYTYPKLPTAKKVSAFVSFHPIPKPRREGRKRREECLSFNGARKICIPGHGQFQWKIFCLALPCQLPLYTVQYCTCMWEWPCMRVVSLSLSPPPSLLLDLREKSFPCNPSYSRKRERKNPCPICLYFSPISPPSAATLCSAAKNFLFQKEETLLLVISTH